MGRQCGNLPRQGQRNKLKGEMKKKILLIIVITNNSNIDNNNSNNNNDSDDNDCDISLPTTQPSFEQEYDANVKSIFTLVITVPNLCIQKSLLAYKSIQTKSLVKTLNAGKPFSWEAYGVQFDCFVNFQQRSAKKPNVINTILICLI